MGRILRVGIDTSINYEFLATTAYDANNPAATTFAWPDSDAMDQEFDEPSPDEVEAEGVLITFDRFPDAFEGAMVKIRPTYTDPEAPSFELWTHNSETDDWTKQRRIDLFNLFVGVESNQRRIVDFTFFPFEPNVDKVWITMDPGPSGTPTMRFIAIKLFGQCEPTLRIPNPPGTGEGDPCALHPDGVDANGNPCLVPGQNCSDFPEFCTAPPPLDLCNPTSIVAYEDYLRNIPGALDEFQSWFATNAALIAAVCAGNSPPSDPPPDMPLPPLPPLPPLDLCDSTSVDAFRAAVGGDADQLATFEDFLSGLEEVGFFDTSCAPVEPPEQYIDPETDTPAEEPVDEEPAPFEAGPGGMPPAMGSGDPPAPGTTTEDGGGSDSGSVIERTTRFILTWSGNDAAAAQTLVDALIAPLPAPSPFQRRSTVNANYGPDLGTDTVGVEFSPAAYGLNLRLSKLPFSCYVSLRCRTFRMRTTVAHPTNELRFSISDAGIHTRPAAGSCPAGPDWIIDTPSTMAEAVTSLVGDDYFEYVFNGNGLSNNILIPITVPREDPDQNDADACTPGFEARSDPVNGTAWQRGGCLAGLTIKERDRWILDNANADFDASTDFDYAHVRPICIVLDVRLDAVVFGKGVDVRSSRIALGTLTDDQPVETCP